MNYGTGKVDEQALLDHFAGLAMQGMIAATERGMKYMTAGIAAEASYTYAAAMIAERNRLMNEKPQVAMATQEMSVVTTGKDGDLFTVEVGGEHQGRVVLGRFADHETAQRIVAYISDSLLTNNISKP